MIKFVAGTGLALSIAVASSAGAFAAGSGGAVFSDGVISGAIVQQRIDTEEVALPPAPTGPATPIPFCSPTSPICP